MNTIHFGIRSIPPCPDCDGDQCTMNCGPVIDGRENIPIRERLADANVLDTYYPRFKEFCTTALAEIGRLEKEIAVWETAAAQYETEEIKRLQNELTGQVDKLLWRNQELETFLEAFRGLVSESSGVAGLHQNGDVAPWDELLPGGRFEEWLGCMPEPAPEDEQ